MHPVRWPVKATRLYTHGGGLALGEGDPEGDGLAVALGVALCEGETVAAGDAEADADLDALREALGLGVGGGLPVGTGDLETVAWGLLDTDGLFVTLANGDREGLELPIGESDELGEDLLEGLRLGKALARGLRPGEGVTRRGEGVGDSGVMRGSCGAALLQAATGRSCRLHEGRPPHVAARDNVRTRRFITRILATSTTAAAARWG